MIMMIEIDFKNIFTHDRIIGHLNEGCKVDLRLFEGKLTAFVVKGDREIKIQIHELNDSHDYANHVKSTFRRSTLQGEIQTYNNINMDGEKLDMLYCTTNMSTEAAEINQLSIRNVFFGKSISLAKMVSEFSDLCWYQHNLFKIFKVNLYQVLRANVIKLAIRYPQNDSIKLGNKNETEENIAIERFLTTNKTA